MKTLKIIIALVFTFIFLGAIQAQENADSLSILLKDGFTDSRDGEHYPVVQIGNQLWMGENMRHNINWSYLIPRDKEGFQYNSELIEWHKAEKKTGVADLEQLEKIGRFYDWSEAMKVCPEGWHLPTKQEWQTMVKKISEQNGLAQSDDSFMGVARLLKVKSGWQPSWGNRNGVDELGFGIVPAGLHDSFRNEDSYLGKEARFWTATEGMEYHPDFVQVKTKISFFAMPNYYACSVRCVKD